MNYLMTANDVANELGVSKGHAYKVIRILNEELREKGFVVITGKIIRTGRVTVRKSGNEVSRQRRRRWSGKAIIN